MPSDAAEQNSAPPRRRLFFARYEKRLSIFAFALGFLWDSLTLTSIDRLFDNIALLSYLVIAFASIALINASRVRDSENPLLRRGVAFARFLLPFSFGGLFSGFLIFYSKSGPVLSSAPFFLFLLALFLGNEFFRRQYQRFVFQMSVFFAALFSYVELVVPVLVGRIGGTLFFVSGITALVLFFLLFFNNMIPPIPLSLKESGIYHNVERTKSGEYRLSFEEAPWYRFGQETNAVFHRSGNEPIFAFSSVFAPSRL